MRYRLVCFIVATLLCAAAGAQTSVKKNASPPGPAPQPALKPWVSRQTTFNIPFSVDLSRGRPSEVQLFVSQDAGGTWRLFGRQAPTEKHFAFRAGGDGQYWFASRTIDPQRNVARIDQLRPELHVVVDTKQPELDFTAAVGPSGEIKTAWKVSDPSLDPATMKIEYQTPDSGRWRQVAIDRSKLFQRAGTSVGEMTWWPEDSADALTIRAEVADAAGNRTVVNRQVARRQVASGNAASPVPSNPYAKHYETNTAVTKWPANRERPTEDEVADNAPPQHNSTAKSTTPNDVDKPYYDRPELGNSTDYSPVRGSTFPLVADPVETREQRLRGLATSSPDSAGLPDGERPHMTNSLHFQLDYELDAVGPEGVDEVQLWGTRDFGQTWTRWSLDEDLRSPLEIQVEREGMYGFRVVIVGRNGLATPAPHSGDLAEIWVGVDTTRPAARLSSVMYGEGLQAGELDIRWQASDERLGERAVTLLFSEQAAGPWNTIAAGLPNSGQYYWRVDPNMSAEIFLRLEVHDEAGNQTEHQLVEPISTRGLIPKAFIRSVRPIAQPQPEANRSSPFRYSR
jgi:hypothetical protein